MEPTAVALMIVALVLVWGGLVVFSIALYRKPNATGGWADEPDIDHEDE